MYLQTSLFARSIKMAFKTNYVIKKTLWILEDPDGVINILFCDLLRYLLPIRQQINLQRVGTNIQTLQLIN